MKSTRVAVLVTGAALLLAGDAGHGQQQGLVRRARKPIPNQYIVVLNGGEDPGQSGRQMAAAHGGRAMFTFRRALNGFSVRMTPDAAAALALDPRVSFIEEDSQLVISQVQTGAPADLDRIDQRQLPLDGSYAYGEVGSFVRVHVIDTGIRASHQEFQGRAVVAGDFVDDDGDFDPGDVGNDDGDPANPDGADCHGHGTHVAGTVGGATYGVAKGVALYSYRVLGCDGSGSLSSALAAIDAITADSYRPAVANMSLGGDPSDALDAAVRSSIAAGITYVVAAGNSFSNASNFSPARVAEAVTVGATDVNDVRAFFSNYGSAVDLFAPGVSITSAGHTSDDATATFSGTSMAAPHVTGVAALYLSRQPNLAPAEVHAQLVSAATPNVVVGAGTGSPNRVLYSDLTHLSAPVVELVAPEAGAKVLSERPYSIQWNASDPDGLAGFDVLLSTDSGTSYAPLAGCSGLDGSIRQCTWASPSPATSTARVRVVARDAGGDSAFDQSSANFSIASGADLLTTGASHSSGALSPGSSVTVTDTVRNAGNVASDASTTRYYLSVDGVKGFNDPRMTGSRSVPALSPDALSTGSAVLPVPSTIAAGSYYLLACADDSHTVDEVEETNNCAVDPAVIVIEFADLTTTALANPPAAGAPGTSFIVSDTVLNTSNVTASSSTTRYFLSEDSAKDSADVLLSGTRSVPSLEAGQASAGSRSVTIPTSTSDGTYRLIACADDTLRVKETDESNNCGVSTSTMLIGSPDLVTTEVSNPPTTAAPGSAFTVADTVKNASPIDAGASTTRYYLSQDAALSSDDVKITITRSVDALAAGTSSSGSRTVTVPSSTVPGVYRVLACADDSLRVKESDESNNCAASATAVNVQLPDLIVSAVGNPPATSAAGATFSITDTTKNASAVPAAASTTRYYLSTDGARSADDLQITSSRYVGALSAGEASSGSRTITVPTSTADGAYRVLACADDTLNVDESNEGNNCAASAGSVLVGTPDLVTVAVSAPPATAAPGTSFKVTDTVQNVSIISSGSSTTRYYLSLDGEKSADDVLITATRFVASLAPGASSTASRTITIPSLTAPGVYRLLACADDLEKVMESNEGNNCRASEETLTIPTAQAASGRLPDTRAIHSGAGRPAPGIFSGERVSVLHRRDALLDEGVPFVTVRALPE
jgi:subtilase family serine protease